MSTAQHPRDTRTPVGGRRVRRPLAAVAALGAVALLGACASGDPGSATPTEATPPTDEVTLDPAPTPAELELVAGSTVVGLPDGIGPQPGDAQAGAARTSDASLLYVVTFGSSTCPVVPSGTAGVADDGSVTVELPELGDGPCTMDLVPSTTVVGLPGPADPDADLVVTVGDLGQVTLPAGSEDVVWSVVTG